MADDAQQFQVDKGPIMAATVLIGIGGLLAFIGIVIGVLQALNEGSKLVNQLETPPSELARARIEQLRTAATAGVNAWKETNRPAAGA